jgi:hypothetical protein
MLDLLEEFRALDAEAVELAVCAANEVVALIRRRRSG